MKKSVSCIVLCVSLLGISLNVKHINAMSQVETLVRCEVSKVIMGVLRNPMIAHPYDIVEVLIKKLSLLISHGNSNPKVANLCGRLQDAINRKQGALVILSILKETEPLLSPEAITKLQQLSSSDSMKLLSVLTKQIKESPRKNIESVEALFRC